MRYRDKRESQAERKVAQKLKEVDARLKPLEESSDKKTRLEARVLRNRIKKILVLIGSISAFALVPLIGGLFIHIVHYVQNRRMNQVHEERMGQLDRMNNQLSDLVDTMREAANYAQVGERIARREMERRRNIRNLNNNSPSASPSYQGSRGSGLRSLDLEDRPHNPDTSPGEHTGRFSGIDLDSGYLVNAHDSNYLICLAKSIRRADAGVKGMKKGQHIKAQDPDYLSRIRNGAVGAGAVALGAGALLARKKGLFRLGKKAPSATKAPFDRLHTRFAKQGARGRLQTGEGVTKSLNPGKISRAFHLSPSRLGFHS